MKNLKQIKLMMERLESPRMTQTEVDKKKKEILDEYGSSAENLELKNLAKQIYSIIKKEGLGVKIASPGQDPYAGFSSSKDWIERKSKDRGKEQLYQNVEIFIDSFKDGGDFLHVVFPEGTILAKVTGELKEMQINEIDIDYASWNRYYAKVKENKPKIISYLNNLAKEIQQLMPGSMEVRYEVDNEFEVYRVFIRLKETKKGGYTK
jgi:hypothetical protein